MTGFRKIICSQRGQSIIELGLALPLFLLLSLGAIEISNMLNTYLVLTHLTREGANVASREEPTTDPDCNLDCVMTVTIPADLTAVIAAASPVIKADNPGQWTVIYSRIGPSLPTGDDGNPNGCSNSGDYVILHQITNGGLENKSSKIGIQCDLPENPTNDGQTPADFWDSIGSGYTLHAVEVFYTYESITPVGNFPGISLGGEDFYERAIF